MQVQEHRGTPQGFSEREENIQVGDRHPERTTATWDQAGTISTAGAGASRLREYRVGGGREGSPWNRQLCSYLRKGHRAAK